MKAELLLEVASEVLRHRVIHAEVLCFGMNHSLGVQALAQRLSFPSVHAKCCCFDMNVQMPGEQLLQAEPEFLQDY
ncbi:hypothetical protein [Leptolyngbya sp. FACHB-261]|uniref:hypothetical protein n=1 Tax=Leptolyngbya sp. FACHB-261 TaxID=2692806 RepID=UPI0016856795|nr:hypothetical protein [Leptolyngbya sp. FACHB-261]MBD2100031.1 hypothetical protein [Leptolyngbya sp. FACHB-261]